MMDMYLGILTATRFMPLFLLLSALVGPTAHRKGTLKCQPRHGNGTTTVQYRPDLQTSHAGLVYPNTSPFF
jgi:hypothetical protein